MKYIVKFEYRPEWNAENNPNIDDDWIVDEHEIDRLAIEWGPSKAELMEQVTAIPTQVRVDGEWHDIDAVINLMNGELREELHRKLAPCFMQYFVDRYIEEHRDRFGEEFQIN